MVWMRRNLKQGTLEHFSLKKWRRGIETPISEEVDKNHRQHGKATELVNVVEALLRLLLLSVIARMSYVREQRPPF